MTKKLALKVKHLVKPYIDILEGLGWEWMPEVGQFMLRKDNQIFLNIDTGRSIEGIHVYYYDSSKVDIVEGHKAEFTPILEWEEIKGLLKQLPNTYNFYIENERWGTYSCNIRTMEQNIWSEGRSRQEATMKAVIELR